MLNKKEMDILKLIIANITEDLTISDISRLLKQKYAQTYNLMSIIYDNSLIKKKNIGKSIVIKPDLSHEDYIGAEIERRKDILKQKNIALVYESIRALENNFICVLFGSYAKCKQKKDSDIDLLFIVDSDTEIFERKAKNQLSLYNVDINIITPDELFNMWSSADKTNVGNELLKAHVVLYGADHFINLLRKHYAGR